MLDPAWLLIISMLVLGKAYRQWQVFDPTPTALVLNRYVIYVALPPLVINTLQSLDLRLELLWMLLLPWLLMALTASLVLLTSRLLGWSRRLTGTLLMLAPLGNTAFLGYPIIGALLGEEALPPAVIYDQFGSFILLSSYGLIIAASYGSGASVTLKACVDRIVRFPPFSALIIALLPIPWPSAALDIMQTVGASLVPVACFAVGLQWRLRLSRHLWTPLSLGLGAKLIFMPLCAALILQLAGTAPVLTHVGILQSGMPPMITAGAIAASAGLDEELAAAMVGFGIIFSMLSLPLLGLWPLYG